MKFPINSKGVIKSSITALYNYQVVKVIAHTDDGFIIVDNPYGGVRKISEDNFLTEVEALAYRAVLVEEKRRIEEEFNNVKSKIKVKMDEAAALITEAQAMSTLYCLRELREEVDNLNDALSKSGWHTSYASC